ncbi:MAG: hypothetical protein KC613_24680, partial [Myxococcales bacterium]|nr:hypothetical protein [Myxococcales bacterium]
MRWQDVQHPPGQWAGLRFTLADGPAKGRLRVEVAAPQRLRLRIHDRPLLWARIDRDHSGVRWARGARPGALVPPIDFPTARATDGPAAWARHFAQALYRANALDRGQWLLMPPWDPLTEPATRRGPPVYGLAAVPGLADRGRLDWGLNGSAEVLPLRPPSAADAGRVKA